MNQKAPIWSHKNAAQVVLTRTQISLQQKIYHWHMKLTLLYTAISILIG